MLGTEAPGIGYAEDWTASIRHYCMRCSYGTPHQHAEAASPREGQPSWQTDRNLGIAAVDRAAVDALLNAWQAGGAGRRIDAVQTRELPVPDEEESWAWWVGPEGAEDEAP